MGIREFGGLVRRLAREGVCGKVLVSGGRPTCWMESDPFFGGERQSFEEWRFRAEGWSGRRVRRNGDKIEIRECHRVEGCANRLRFFFDPARGRVVREVSVESIEFVGRGPVPSHRRRGNPRQGADRGDSRFRQEWLRPCQQSAGFAVTVESALDDLGRERGAGGLSVPVFQAGEVVSNELFIEAWR
jgi:hypothetical protein